VEKQQRRHEDEAAACAEQRPKSGCGKAQKYQQQILRFQTPSWLSRECGIRVKGRRVSARSDQVEQLEIGG
jgi:hypothetical protein